jgi:hypothetical protein
MAFEKAPRAQYEQYEMSGQMRHRHQRKGADARSGEGRISAQLDRLDEAGSLGAPSLTMSWWRWLRSTA